MEKPGIWVAEGYWSSSVTDGRTVRPMMAMLEANDVAFSVHRQINDIQDLVNSLTDVGKREHAQYSIVYIACHGSSGAVAYGEESISLAELADALPDGILDSKLVHFGSCSVLDDEESIKTFQRSTGVRGITGYTLDVGWIESAAFELLMFQTLTRYSRLGWFEKAMARDYGDLTASLGFTVVR